MTHDLIELTQRGGRGETGSGSLSQNSIFWTVSFNSGVSTDVCVLCSAFLPCASGCLWGWVGGFFSIHVCACLFLSVCLSVRWVFVRNGITSKAQKNVRCFEVSDCFSSVFLHFRCFSACLLSCVSALDQTPATSSRKFNLLSRSFYFEMH